MKYIIYTRQSKPSKKTKIIPLSHDMQREKCIEAIPKNGEKIFIMDPSGADNNIMKRKTFLESLELIKKSDVFVVYSLDRLCRDFYQMGYVKTIIEQKGAYLISATEKDINRTMMGFTAVMADSQKQQIRSRTKDALTRLKELGYRVGTIPFGYKVTDENKIIKYQTEYVVLEKMQTWAQSGLSQREIAVELNKAGISNRKGSSWSHVSIHKILKNAQGHREAYLESHHTDQCI